MGLFWLNEIYRFHIILLSFGLAKILSILVFSMVFCAYLLMFWPQFRQTKYWIFALGIILLFVAILIDTLHLKNDELASVLEGIPKLLSEVNLALYFWDTCQKELLQTFK
jgi:MFS superfamily sulfate permease-like transporter